MSSQRGNVQRSRPQKHRNATVFKNDKYDSNHLTKKLNSKLHDGVCQRCKDVLEWRVKFSKYKPLSQPKKWIRGRVRDINIHNTGWIQDRNLIRYPGREGGITEIGSIEGDSVPPKSETSKESSGSDGSKSRRAKSVCLFNNDGIDLDADVEREREEKPLLREAARTKS
ncbi:Hypothetical predicted protein, partial [Pelobates cultripes]